MLPMCNVGYYSLVVSLYWHHMFQPNRHLQVYRLLSLRNLLLLVKLLCFCYILLHCFWLYMRETKQHYVSSRFFYHNNLYTWSWPVRPDHVVSLKKNDEWIVTNVVYRQHKNKTQSQICMDFMDLMCGSNPVQLSLHHLTSLTILTLNEVGNCLWVVNMKAFGRSWVWP
jgi:hypothetical protein